MTPFGPSQEQAVIGGQQLTAPAATTQPLNTWQEHIKDMPLHTMTDAAYDGMREHFFYDKLAPAILQSGQSLENMKQSFMSQTPRPDRMEMPRLMTTMTSAGQALTAPISGMNQHDPQAQAIQHYIDAQAEEAASEATRQGYHAAPYQLLGQGLGMAPYFAEGLMGPEAVGEAAALRGIPNAGRVLTEEGKEVLSKEAVDALSRYNRSIITKAEKSASVGLVQGAYDAASAPEGQKGSAALRGAAIGTSFAAGIEGVGSMWSFLRANHNLSEDTAKAVDSVAKTGGDARERVLTNNAVLGSVDLEKSVGGYVAATKQAAAKQGVPGDVSLDIVTGQADKAKVFTPSGRIRIEMQGADGKPYHLGGAVGLKAEDLDKINSRIVEHLNAGGSLQAMHGDPTLINQTLLNLEKMNPEAFKLENPLRGEVRNPITVPAQEEPPAEQAATARASIHDDKIGYVFQYEDGTYPHNGQDGKTLIGTPTDDIHNTRIYKDEDEIYDVNEKLTKPGHFTRSVDGQLIQQKINVVPAQLKQRLAFAVDSPDIPEYDKFHQLPNGEVVNSETGELIDFQDWLKMDPAYGKTIYYKDTPLYHRIVGNSPRIPDNASAAEIEYPGEEDHPTLAFRPNPSRADIFHENLHGHFGALHLHGNVMRIMGDSTSDQIFRSGFSPVAADNYGYNPYIWREEVYVHGADAIRTGNHEKIAAFAEADTDKETWLGWMNEKTQRLQNAAATKEDSLHKRALERKLNAVSTRATNTLEDIRNAFSQDQREIEFAHGQYKLTDGKSGVLYSSREEMLAALEANHEPLNSPELVPMDRLPEGVPRYSRSIPPMKAGDRANITDPPEPMKQARGGLQLFSNFFRPFNDWMATVAQKNDWPELYKAFEPMDRAQVAYNNLIRPHFETLQRTMGKYSQARQKDFMQWFKDPDSQLLQDELRFTPKELDDLHTVTDKVLAPLARDLNLSLQDYVKYTLPKVAAQNGDVMQAFPKPTDFMQAKLKAHALDPKEDNFVKLVAKYMEFGGWDKHVRPVVDMAEKTIQEDVNGDRSFSSNWQDKRAGNLYPLLQRHIDYMRGQPDFTQQIIKGAMEGAVDMINQGLEKVNGQLGTKMHIEELSEDPLSKYTKFLYAGTLAMKPSTIVRDGLQILLTSYPVLGKYMFTGLRKAFGAFNKDQAEELWSIPQKYGALIERNDLRSLYDGAATEGVPGKTDRLEKIADWGMKSIQLTHNSNRLAAFWGHSEQVLDALDTYRASGDKPRFLRDSGMWFMSPSMQEKFASEAATLTKGQLNDYSYRAAKELVELTQWNFKRGANPGLYEYQLGRLLGQYGTWPLNYIEYARRLATAGDGLAVRNALTRLTLAHGAVLAAGQGVGIDTSKWVFTGPMAWEGGPWMQAIQSAPTALTTGQAGSDARENVLGVIPGVDRALTTKHLFQSVSTGDKDFWIKLLGFHTLPHGKE